MPVRERKMVIAMNERDMVMVADGGEGDGNQTAGENMYIMINVDIRRLISRNSTKYIYCL